DPPRAASEAENSPSPSGAGEPRSGFGLNELLGIAHLSGARDRRPRCVTNDPKAGIVTITADPAMSLARSIEARLATARVAKCAWSSCLRSRAPRPIRLQRPVESQWPPKARAQGLTLKLSRIAARSWQHGKLFLPC